MNLNKQQINLSFALQDGAEIAMIKNMAVKLHQKSASATAKRVFQAGMKLYEQNPELFKELLENAQLHGITTVQQN